MCFTEIHVRRKPELGEEQEASEHLKEGGKTHEPKSTTTTTTTTTLPSTTTSITQAYPFFVHYGTPLHYVGL